LSGPISTFSRPDLNAMFEDDEGIRLPHPPLSLRFHLVVEAAICAAWELMQTAGRIGFNLETAEEDIVTHELYERLYDEVFDKNIVDGFNREIFASVRREPKVRTFDGSSLDKMPDLLIEFIDRPAGVMNSQYGLFIECKPSTALPARTTSIPTSFGPEQCPRGCKRVFAERAAVSKHRRTFNYIEDNAPAGEITIRHVWLQRGSALS
jgi:hypothetical protein